MQHNMAMSIRFSLLLSQVIVSCLGQYSNDRSSDIAAGISGVGIGSGHGYGGGTGMVSPPFMRFGTQSVQGLGYGLGYADGSDQMLGYGNGYDPAPSYGSRYDQGPGYGGGYNQGLGYGGGYNQVLGYVSSNAVPSAIHSSIGSGYGPMGSGISYGDGTGYVNGAAYNGFGGGMPAYPYTPLYTPMIVPPTITSPQQQAFLTSNENTNTNTNINIDNKFGKHRHGHLIRGLLGIPQL